MFKLGGQKFPEKDGYSTDAYWAGEPGRQLKLWLVIILLAGLILPAPSLSSFDGSGRNVELPTARADSGGGIVVGNGQPTSCTEVALNNALAGGGLVTFNCGANPLTITLSATQVITKDAVLDGGNLITLSGNYATRVISVTSGLNFSLQNINIVRGQAAGSVGNAGPGGNAYGGGIFNNGSHITITNSFFVNNQSTGGRGYDTIPTPPYRKPGGDGTPGGIGNGGAIYNNAGTLRIISTTFSSNKAVGGAGGNGSHTYDVDYFFGSGGRGGQGRGGAVYNSGGVVIVSSSTISNNWASGGMGGNSPQRGDRVSDFGGAGDGGDGGTGAGGAIYNDAGTLSLDNSTVALNYADGSRGGTGDLTDNSGIGGRGGTTYGGGIYNFYNSSLNPSTPVLTLTNSTLYGNVAKGGSGNMSAYFMQGGSGGDAYGGGVAGSLTATIAITNSTIWSNQATGGLGSAASFMGSVGPNGTGQGSSMTQAADVQNSVIAGAVDSVAVLNCTTVLNDKGHNVQFPGNDCGQSILSANPKLGGVAPLGGSTSTVALMEGSPAIDNGNAATCAAPPINNLDQRGVTRPVGLNCDIGAFEGYLKYPITTIGFSPNVITAGATSLLQFRIANPNSIPLTNINITDTLPSQVNVVNSYSSNVISDCNTSGYSYAYGVSVYLNSLNLGANSSCNITVTLTSSAAGIWTNTSGPFTSAQTGIGNTSNQVSLTVLSQPANHLSLSVSPYYVYSGTPFNATVYSQDQYGNVDTSVNGLLQFSSSDPYAILPDSARLVNGSANTSLTLFSTTNQALTFAVTTTTNNQTITGNRNIYVFDAPNRIELTSSLNPVTYAEPISLTARVTSSNGSPYTPTGSVTFKNNQQVLGNATLVNGVANLTISSTVLGAGSYPISASYSGDSNFNSVVSRVVTQIISPAPTTLTLISSSSVVSNGGAVVLTATVNSSIISSTLSEGIVQFYDNVSTLITTSNVISGVASVSVSRLSPGTHQISATYTGASNFKPSSSLALTITSSGSQFTVGVEQDNGLGDQTGTLSYVIKQASLANQPVSIDFSPDVHQIVISNSLPLISNINGYTITLNGGTGINTVPKIRLLASPTANPANLRVGLTLGERVIVVGLAVTGFSDYGIEMLGSYNQLLSCYIGVAPDGTIAANGKVVTGDALDRPKGGVHIVGSNNYLGTAGITTSANLISGNNGVGLLIEAGSTLNRSFFSLIGSLPGEQSPSGLNIRGAIQVKPGGQLLTGLGNKAHS